MTRKIAFLLIFAGAAFTLSAIVFSPALSWAQDAGVVACQTGKCHADRGQAKFVHGPVAAGACTACHRPRKGFNPNKHSTASFTIAAKGKELCFMCHEAMQKRITGKFIHGPVAMGDCTACHSPHESDAKFQLRKNTTSELCFSCHENTKTVKEFIHGPVAAGDCNICHNPHSSDYKFQLEEEGNNLCFMCHEDRRDEFNRKTVHPPVKESCQNCHDPHNSDHQFQLKKEKMALCLGCHTKKAEHIKSIKVQHGAIEQGTCVACHTPHSSNYVKLLKLPTKQICYSCHKEKGAEVLSSKHLHGPVKQDDCPACHDPHGSNNTRILREFFPPEFYMEFKVSNFNICWQCHNKDVVLTTATTTLTGFRNGQRNLHFVHVNKKKGRSCKACHQVHAGDQEKHIRKEVPFGSSGWKLPVTFTKLPTGGKCVVGCHRPRGYDRESPIVQK